jgi:2-(1,2-epoxy-1,2-dihydrophenyl)acetyl-CoA isomerase
MAYQTILYARDGAILTITLNRPERLTSFTPELHGELKAALATAAAPESGVRAVILTGAGRAFCSGQDLSQAQGDGGPADLGHTIETLYNPLVRQMRAMPVPIVAAVNGLAAGAGASLALAADVTVAARSAYFLLAFANIGLVPDSGATFFLPRLIGDARARAMAMLADRVPAEEAARWGLIWAAVDDDKVLAEARAIAEKLAAKPPLALGYIKQALNQSAANTLDGQLDLERDLQRQAGGTEDFQEAVTAFLEKRQPRFVGR